MTPLPAAGTPEFFFERFLKSHNFQCESINKIFQKKVCLISFTILYNGSSHDKLFGAYQLVLFKFNKFTL